MWFSPINQPRFADLDAQWDYLYLRDHAHQCQVKRQPLLHQSTRLGRLRLPIPLRLPRKREGLNRPPPPRLPRRREDLSPQVNQQPYNPGHQGRPGLQGHRVHLDPLDPRLLDRQDRMAQLGLWHHSHKVNCPLAQTPQGVQGHRQPLELYNPMELMSKTCQCAIMRPWRPSFNDPPSPG